MSTGRVIGIVVGSLVLLAGLGLILGGGGVLVAERILADDDGFVSFRPGPVDEDAHAIVMPVRIDGGSWFWRRHVVTARIEVEGRGAEPKPLFLGLADRADTDKYLAGVQRVEVRDLRFPEGDVPLTRRPQAQVDVLPGSASPASPTLQSFWMQSATGSRAQSLQWRLEPGDYALVLMNADGSRGIAATAAIGLRAPIILRVAGAGLGLGVVLLALGVTTIVLAARGARPQPTPDAAQPATSTYPVALRAEYTEALSPVLWLAKWLLLIPHFVVLGFLWTGFACSWLVTLFAILFTGRYPRGLFEYNVGVLRWTWRVGFYGYQALGTDAYPPFTLKAGGYPADLEVRYPEKLSRRLVLVKWWLLAIPHYLIMGLLVGVGPHWGGLVVVLTILVGVILLFSSRYPRELFGIIVGANRWAFRVLAYVSLMTDEYPPFQLEE